jgi:Fur family ferric uptake transcriptional regulator
MTRARTAVLATMEAAPRPLCAADVIATLEGSCDQATVYRALHYLEGTGLLESFVLNCAECGVERFYISKRSPHRHWFHCESCHRFIDLGACTLGGMVAAIERDLGVQVTGHTLYLTGRCAECSKRG